MDRSTREGHQGTGPGAITPDGCAVEMYARLHVGNEPEIIAGAVPEGARLLELGSGAGRVTRHLLRRGFDVVAVDESAAMLERVRGARTVCSPIETLRLDERFDVVMLASYLVNTADAGLRARLLATCARHVAPGGCVLVQRENDLGHIPENLPSERRSGDMLVRIVSAEPLGGGRSAVRIEYVFEDAEWSQNFVSQRLDRAAFEEALGEAGLRVDAYLAEDGSWARAVPRG